MRRWNGWGEEGIDYPLPDSGAAYLERALGVGLPTPDASLESCLNAVPAPRLGPRAGLSLDARDRLLHARGQSLPDWVALRSGRIEVVPDGVAHPSSAGEVADLLDWARSEACSLIPYGGGTSVVGHINPLPSDRPVITVDLGVLSRLIDQDESSRLATFEAGIRGPDLESALQARGYTLGHFPQSFEGSTLGGWIATRSSGQQSLGYGRIEALFAGGHLETPQGTIALGPVPASAAGPDLRHMVLGSEGRLGVLTRAVVRVSPLPEKEEFFAAFLPSWSAGIEAARAIVWARPGLSMLRLSDPIETETTLALAGRDRLVAWADRGLRALGFGDGRCLLLAAASGESRRVRRARAEVSGIVRRHAGLPVGTPIGSIWQKTRFRAPYLRNTLWDRGYALDTLETALPWHAVASAVEAVRSSLTRRLEPQGERVLAFIHLSHVYPDGASLYATLIFRRAVDPDETLARWRSLKHAATHEILAHGGTISHQHGVGLDHAPYLEAEKGTVGLSALRAMIEAVDPEGILNPGKLVVSRQPSVKAERLMTDN
jgi:alkyldihydroxyacetonephosphate synthase